MKRKGEREEREEGERERETHTHTLFEKPSICAMRMPSSSSATLELSAVLPPAATSSPLGVRARTPLLLFPTTTPSSPRPCPCHGRAAEKPPRDGARGVTKACTPREEHSARNTAATEATPAVPYPGLAMVPGDLENREREREREQTHVNSAYTHTQQQSESPKYHMTGAR